MSAEPGIIVDRLLPQCPDAEKGVLCSMIYGGAALIRDMDARLRPEYFYVREFGTIFHILTAMGRAGIPVDPITLINELQSQGVLEGIGGKAFIFDLFRDSWTACNASNYADIVAEHHARRELIALGAECTSRGFEGREAREDVEHLLDEIRAKALALGAGLSRHGLPSIVDGTEAANLYGQEIPSEIVGGALRQSEKIMIGGASKSGKTWILADLALSVATGKDWLGFPVTKGRVLFINLEIQPFAFAKRQNDIALAKGIDLKQGELHVWNLRGHCADLTVLARQIIQRARDGGYSLIIIDPIYKVLGGRDENSAGEIGNLLNEVERLAVETGAAVAFGHHFTKGNASGKESIDRVSGSGTWGRDPDTILTLTAHEEEGAYVVESIVRNFPPIAPFTVRWNYPLMVRDDALDPAKLKKPKTGRPPKYSVQDLLDAIGFETMTGADFEKAVRDETGMSRGSFYDLLRAAKAQEKLTQKEDKRWTRP